ncbi:hypothetical protein A2127_00945 [Candidatus Jorgensenbacteria bacterium GWC1_48_12]|uniref:Uncharacterized protein n=1 Tax=Candidatus Jorgensenbacteria bacterium GWC1_48_12 TaxID=1798469 RepID=A0A1F6BM93_9BACT|nr:MAG: hypothetical protein A2127_00945 [Candidatus Jorgensenbacteria bacterium GWC1_48_12]
MDFKKNKTLVTVVVLFVAFGLVMAYVPLLFSPSPAYNQAPISAEQEDAQLALPIVEPETEVTATTSTSSAPAEDEQTLPDGFSGLEEESESLDGLLNDF